MDSPKANRNAIHQINLQYQPASTKQWSGSTFAQTDCKILFGLFGIDPFSAATKRRFINFLHVCDCLRTATIVYWKIDPMPIGPHISVGMLKGTNLVYGKNPMSPGGSSIPNLVEKKLRSEKAKTNTSFVKNGRHEIHHKAYLWYFCHFPTIFP